ncbi:unnamed protein product [Schistocephalus solidus]|uniref:Troponin T, skeletal muscle n=1 Tax=Schistocephalus solidus TaxID=70667 RepID=A0A183STQ7_SCHSO|nr:unnamed protein product [Schistocephalus solidus]
MVRPEYPHRGEEGVSAARLKMEAEAKKRRERAEEEWKEYEEMRRAEREKEDEEIRELRERREERMRKKREEEQRKREERERKRAEFEEKSKLATRRNFVINKKSGSVEMVEEVKKEEVTKSKEQLEAERKAILEQRIQPLQIDGLKGEQLRAKAKELNELIMRLEGDKYDLEQRFTRQSYDMQELAERARQMNKGDKRSKQVQNAPDPLAAKISGIPPKVSMYSEYERVKDHRTFVERKTVFAGPLFVERYERIEPSTTVIMTEEGFVVGGGKPRSEASAEPSAAEPEPAPAEVKVEE